MRRSPAAATRSRRAAWPLDGQDEGFSSYFRRGGSLDQRRDWAPMLDLLWAAANKGTGRRAALAVPTFGKTGTSQDNRDALFIGFAGNLVVGVWVGRDDNKSLGKISGGTAPATHLAQFHGAGARRSTAAPGRRCRRPSACPRRRRHRAASEKKSPLPEDWSDGTRGLRDLVEELENLIDDADGR